MIDGRETAGKVPLHRGRGDRPQRPARFGELADIAPVEMFAEVDNLDDQRVPPSLAHPPRELLVALPKFWPLGVQLVQPGIAVQFRLPGVGVVCQRFEKVAVDVDPAVEVAKERFGFLEEGIGEGGTTNMY
jgi:hypothetical protein